MQRKSASRRQIRAALKTLQPHMPSPWNLDEFVHNLANRRGRPIELRAAHFEVLQDGNRTSGMWVEEPALDVIYWDVTLPALREAAIAHEIAHMVLDHPRKVLTSRDADGLVLHRGASPSGRPASSRVLFRHDYEADIEKEAESLGTLLVYDIAQRQLRRAPSTVVRVATQLR